MNKDPPIFPMYYCEFFIDQGSSSFALCLLQKITGIFQVVLPFE